MIFYDHTDTFCNGLNMGIQRVVRRLACVLKSEVPDDFVPVIQYNGDFRVVPVGSTVDRLAVHPIRKLIRRIGAGPLRRVQKWSNDNRHLVGLKTKIWQFLDASQVQGTRIRPGANDWYLTADSIWNQPQILKALPELRSMGVRTAIVHHDLIPLSHPEWCDPKHRESFAPYAEALPAFDVVFCVSDFVEEQFREFCWARSYPPPKNVVIIPLGYEISAGFPSSKRPLDLYGGMFVLCVGTLEPRKNYRTLLEAFNIIWDRGVNVSLVIVGSPGYASKGLLTEFHNHPRFEKRLFHLTNCSDEELEQLYDLCVFTIQPSLFEGYGLPVVESLARGKPCVCSDIPVFHETAGKFGVYFNPTDAHSIAFQVETLYSDQNSREALEASILSEYRPSTWKDSARTILGGLGYSRLSTPDARPKGMCPPRPAENKDPALS